MVERYSQILMCDIIVFFQDGYAPHWLEMEMMFSRHKLSRGRTFEMDFLPVEFIMELFENTPEILRRVEAMSYRHHQILIMLIKDTYGMMSCVDCGCVWRNPFVKKRVPPRSFFYAGKNTFCHSKRQRSRSRSNEGCSSKDRLRGRTIDLHWFHFVPTRVYCFIDVNDPNDEEGNVDVETIEVTEDQEAGQDVTGCKDQGNIYQVK